MNNKLTEDLVLSKPRTKKVKKMSKAEIISLINESIDMKNWTDKDLTLGKEVDIFDEWKSVMDKIIWEYKFAGWNVFHYRNGRREYLQFDFPRKEKK
jgi:hypothetical protein